MNKNLKEVKEFSMRISEGKMSQGEKTVNSSLKEGMCPVMEENRGRGWFGAESVREGKEQKRGGQRSTRVRSFWTLRAIVRISHFTLREEGMLVKVECGGC